MAEIIKTYRESVPAMRFIGKKSPDFGGWWGEWFANGWFDVIERAMGGVDAILKIWESGGGYIGLELRGKEQPFENGLCPRYTTPDEKGNVILDYSYFVV